MPTVDLGRLNILLMSHWSRTPQFGTARDKWAEAWGIRHSLRKNVNNNIQDVYKYRTAEAVKLQPNILE